MQPAEMIVQLLGGSKLFRFVFYCRDAVGEELSQLDPFINLTALLIKSDRALHAILYNVSQRLSNDNSPTAAFITHVTVESSAAYAAAVDGIRTPMLTIHRPLRPGCIAWVLWQIEIRCEEWNWRDPNVLSVCAKMHTDLSRMEQALASTPLQQLYSCEELSPIGSNLIVHVCGNLIGSMHTFAIIIATLAVISAILTVTTHTST